MKTNKGLIAEIRPITLEETSLIKWLLDHGEADSEHFKSQLRDLSVFEKCSCGCPAIYFAYRGKPVARKGEHLISDYLATVEGMDVGVMLFETDGYLSSLEVYSQPGSNKPFGLPEISSLLSYEQWGKRQT
jgi:hypothetical protein